MNRREGSGHCHLPQSQQLSSCGGHHAVINGARKSQVNNGSHVNGFLHEGAIHGSNFTKNHDAIGPKDGQIIGRSTATGTIGGSSIKHQQSDSVPLIHQLTNGMNDHGNNVTARPITVNSSVNCVPPSKSSAAKAAREKALHEIRISLQPFANNERPVSSASSTSDSSSSPGQTSGIGSSVSSNQSALFALNPTLQAQLVQQLQNIGISVNHNTNSGGGQSHSTHSKSVINNTNAYPQSPASLSSLYSSISSPPPSYAASSSSGRQSPTPTISSSSDYSSVPPPVINANIHFQKRLSSASSTCSSSHTPTTASNFGARPVQVWTARQAISQSPVIMQSVKSTQVQKPVLQTAIAPTTPPLLNPMSNSMSNFATNHSIQHNNVIQHNSIQHNSIQHNSIQQSKQLTPSGGHSQASSITQLTYPNIVHASSNSNNHSIVSHRNPPPYPSSITGQKINGQSQQRSYVQSSQLQECYPINPPPSYASAVQQRQQQVNPSPQESASVVQSSSPPPPPPPPYTAPLTIPQDPQIISVLSQYRNEFNSTSVQIPTTDPPSYDSSVAALAAQRAAVAFACSNVQSNSNSSVTVTTSRSNNLTNLQLPSRPPPMPPSNSDLVNTVESICTSQISALHGVSSTCAINTRTRQFEIVPPLPPKPNSIQSAAMSDCSDSGSSVYHSPPPCRGQIPSSSNVSSNSNSSNKTTHQSPIPPRKQLSKEKEKERRETKVKNYSPAAFKFFMEQHVENVIKSHQQRERRRQQLESEMAKVGLSEEAQCQMRKMLHQKESNYIRLRRAKMDRSMFKKIKTIGVGAFGEVALVRKTDANQLYAMKTLRKSDVLKRNQVAHVKAERDILAEADNEWVVKLYYSFQDNDHLYFVMDYIPGGDLMSLLIKFGIFQEELSRFYIAELVQAVESVHKMGFIHRDIKPDNILIDRDGHIKLTDFGLCTGFRWTHNSKYYQRNNGIDVHNRQDSMDIVDENWLNKCHCNVNLNKPLERRKRREHQRCLAHSLVGTPNYIAPEVLMRTGYTQLCDWWSVGVILYEMLVGSPPFFANTPEETQSKVIHWDKTLHIPEAAELTPNSTDLILRLCCGPEKRLGINGAEEIKAHPFFMNIDFEGGLRRQRAPYIPEIKYPTDTSNFDPIDPDKLHASGSDGNSTVSVSHGTYDDYVNASNGQFQENGKHPEHAFFEFTFRRFFDDGGNAFPIKMIAENNNSNNNNNNNNADNGQGSPVYV